MSPRSAWRSRRTTASSKTDTYSLCRSINMLVCKRLTPLVSKDDPTRPQIKVMRGSLDPLGMPLATDVLSGERADDGLYLPIIERIRRGLNKTGLLFVGDWKMSALDTRAYLARHQDWYLSPLPLTGATAEAMDAWITAGVAKGKAGELARIWRTNDRGREVLTAEGYV